MLFRHLRLFVPPLFRVFHSLPAFLSPSQSAVADPSLFSLSLPLLFSRLPPFRLSAAVLPLLFLIRRHSRRFVHALSCFPFRHRGHFATVVYIATVTFTAFGLGLPLPSSGVALSLRSPPSPSSSSPSFPSPFLPFLVASSACRSAFPPRLLSKQQPKQPPTQQPKQPSKQQPKQQRAHPLPLLSPPPSTPSTISPPLGHLSPSRLP